MNPASQQERNTAGPIIRPPLLFPGCLILGLVLDQALPLPFALPKAAWVVWAAGAVLISVGIVVFAAGLWSFSRAGTPVPGNRPVRALVTTGIHGISRNPIYVGMFSIYAGIGLAALSAWIIIFMLPIAIVMRYGVVAREEAYLERHFGDSYRDYKARVRRWL